MAAATLCRRGPPWGAGGLWGGPGPGPGRSGAPGRGGRGRGRGRGPRQAHRRAAGAAPPGVEVRLEGEGVTRTLAQLVGRLAGLRRGDCYLVRGPVGAGKSVFCRALVQTLLRDPDLVVPSPTFTFVNAYDAPEAGLTLHHFDLYRLEGLEEGKRRLIGLDAALAGGVTIVEWPEYLGAREGPENYLEIALEGASGGAEEGHVRRAALTASGARWAEVAAGIRALLEGGGRT